MRKLTLLFGDHFVRAVHTFDLLSLIVGVPLPRYATIIERKSEVEESMASVVTELPGDDAAFFTN